MEVLLRGNDGDGGATAVLARCHGGHGGAAATPLRIGPTRGGIAEVWNMFKVSIVPPRRSAVLTVFCGATAISDGTTANHGDHGGATAVYAVQAPQWHRAFGVTGVVLRRHEVSTVPPRRSAVLTVVRGATAINDGTTAEHVNHGDHGGATAVYAVQAPQWHRASGVTAVLHTCAGKYDSCPNYKHYIKTLHY